MSDETLINPDDPLDDDPRAPTPDRDPLGDHPGQGSADLKEDPKSPKSPKKTPARKRFRLEQDPGGPVEAPGASPPLNDEAPMNALSPDRTKKATTTKSTGTKTASPKSVTKPEVQRHHNLSATVVRGPKVEHGEVRWYWRFDRCTNAALGVTERETVFHKWATVTEVQTELASLVTRGAHRPQKVAGGRRIVTFADLIDADAAERGEPAHLQSTTIASWVNRRRWLKSLLGNKIILQTTKDELERLLVAQIQGGRAHATVERATLMLISAWRWACDEQLVTVKPPTLALGRAVKAPKYWPERANVSAVVQSLEGEARLVVEVLAVTGARVGEVVTLRRCDYDPTSHCLTVKGKTGVRRVPVDESVRARLAARADGTTAPLFQWTTTRRDPVQQGDDWVRRVLKRACKRLSIKTFSPHALRRAAVNFFIDQGYDAKLVATFLGHSVEVLMRYYRIPTLETVERMVLTARPGDFSTTSPDRRRALEALSTLLRDEALMEDAQVRGALNVMLNALGQRHTDVGEQAVRQPPHAEAEAAARGVEVPGEATTPPCPLAQPATPPVAVASSTPTATVTAPASTPARAARPQQPAAPSTPSQPKPAVGQGIQRATAGEGSPSRPADLAPRAAPNAQPQRPRPVTSVPPRVEPLTSPSAGSLALRPTQRIPRQEHQRGPLRAPPDKFAKG